MGTKSAQEQAQEQPQEEKKEKKGKVDDATLNEAAQAAKNCDDEFRRIAAQFYGIKPEELKGKHTGSIYNQLPREVRAAHMKVTRANNVKWYMTCFGENVKDVFTPGRTTHGICNTAAVATAMTVLVRGVFRAVTPG